MIIQGAARALIILAIALYAQIRKYRLTPDELQVTGVGRSIAMRTAGSSR